MQLGMALEYEKATLSVKRRLACEAVSYFAQVGESIWGDLVFSVFDLSFSIYKQVV